MVFAPTHRGLWSEKVAPRYIIRDRDAVYGDVFIRRLRAMSIRDRPTAPRSPWQNRYCERAIGSIRRECLDHVVVFGERHLRHLLRSYATYYITRLKRHRRDQYMPLAAFCLRHFSADFIICTCECEFRQAQVDRTGLAERQNGTFDPSATFEALERSCTHSNGGMVRTHATMALRSSCVNFRLNQQHVREIMHTATRPGVPRRDPAGSWSAGQKTISASRKRRSSASPVPCV